MKLFKFRKFFDPTYIPRERRRTQILACLFVWSLLLCFVFQNFVIGSVRVVGRSMEPTLRDGERRMYWKWDYLWRKPLRGDIVVLSDPKDGVLVVKRVIGLPGERVEFREGKVRIGGALLPEPYLDGRTSTFGSPGDDEVFELKEGRYLVLGDNRGASRDSREYGPVRRAKILGMIRIKERVR